MWRIILFTITLSGSGAVAADDLGKALYDEHCRDCHTQMGSGNHAELYQRMDRRVHNRQALSRQVNRCKDNLRLTLFDDEVEAIANYLNQQFYHFDE